MKGAGITLLIFVGLILSSVLLPMINAPRIDVKKARTRESMSRLQIALSLHVQEYGKLPASSLNTDTLDVLTGNNPRKLSFYSAPANLVREGRLMDDWDRPFLFEKTDGNMVIRSAGKDGAYHTKDDLTLDALVREPEASAAGGR